MRDLESNDLAGAAYLSAEQEAWEVEFYARGYDQEHDFRDEPDVTDELFTILDRISFIGGPRYVPFHPHYGDDDLPF